MQFPPADHINFVFNAASTTGTVVHVLDSGAYFNVTGSMTFNNVEFRGDSALAAPAATLTSYTHPPLATIPVKKCVVPTGSADGSHTALTFEQ